jgi:hypothetical protein
MRGRSSPVADLDETLEVLHREGRRRATLPVSQGGFTNLELIGFTKALAAIKVEAVALLENDQGDDEDEEDEGDED